MRGSWPHTFSVVRGQLWVLLVPLTALFSKASTVDPCGGEQPYA
jgi:hypothetical protein